MALVDEARDLGIPSLEASDLDARVHRASLLLERGVAVLSEIQRQDSRTEEQDIDVDELFSELETRPPSGPTLADLSFAGLMELKASLRELVEAKGDDARVSAVESAGRKLRRALRAVLALATNGSQPANGNEELETALAVRRAFAAFRRGLRRADASTPEGVLRAVQYAAGAIAALVGSPEYASLRASDRTMLRSLRDRAFAWARGTRNVSEGLSVLEDIHTSANLLRGINLRQELRVHDWDVLARIPTAPASERLELLARLEGLDDNLDTLLARVRTDGDTTDEAWRLVAARIGDLR